MVTNISAADSAIHCALFTVLRMVSKSPLAKGQLLWTRAQDRTFEG